jgi:hypothetical protein
MARFFLRSAAAFALVLCGLPTVVLSMEGGETVMRKTFTIQPVEPFQWSTVMHLHKEVGQGKGNQIFHMTTKDKPSASNPEAVALIAREFEKAVALQSDAQVLRFGSDHVQIIDGAYIELGVATGRTINFLAGLNPTRTIYGFDSFEGLPKQWDRPDIEIPRGTFAYNDSSFIPPVLENVTLFKGSFREVLPAFQSQILKQRPIAFLHVDCDLYDSTQEALTALADNIVPGTILVFDEFYNYPNYENHEWKALQEFLSKKNFKAEYLAYNSEHEQVAVRIASAHESQDQ